jgi:hypothetical protein
VTPRILRWAAVKLPAFFAILLFAACKSGGEPAPTGKRFQVEVQAAAPSRVRVTPGPGWKMNLEYPNRLEAKSQGGEAVILGPEKAKVSESEVSFSVPAKPGLAYDGRVYFAICTPKTCIPVEEPISWRVPAAK